MESLRFDADDILPPQRQRRQRKTYKSIRPCDTRGETDNHVRTISSNGHKITHNNSSVKCYICPHNHTGHKMEQEYWKCI